MARRGYFYVVVREFSRPIERKLIMEALELNRWNRKETAKQLGMSYRALMNKISSLELRKDTVEDGATVRS